MKSLHYNLLSTIGSIAMAIIYGLKVNLSVAMVAMLNHTAIRASSSAPIVHKVVTLNVTTDDACQESASAEAVEVNELRNRFLWYCTKRFCLLFIV